MISSAIRPLSREELRSIDARAAREFGMPTAILMENAGRNAAALLRDRFAPARVVILCGPGNNGGDGAVLARHLDLWGVNVQVVWLADPAHLQGDAALQWNILEKSAIDQSAWTNQNSITPQRLDTLLAPAGVVVDALLGTGLKRPVEGPLLAAIEAINRSHKPTLSLDIPSGLDADLGIPLPLAVRATLTATFVAPKLGFNMPAAKEFTGEVVVLDIGAPRRLLEPFLANPPQSAPNRPVNQIPDPLIPPLFPPTPPDPGS